MKERETMMVEIEVTPAMSFPFFDIRILKVSFKIPINPEQGSISLSALLEERKLLYLLQNWSVDYGIVCSKIRIMEIKIWVLSDSLKQTKKKGS